MGQSPPHPFRRASQGGQCGSCLSGRITFRAVGIPTWGKFRRDIADFFRGRHHMVLITPVRAHSEGRTVRRLLWYRRLVEGAVCLGLREPDSAQSRLVAGGGSTCAAARSCVAQFPVLARRPDPRIETSRRPPRRPMRFSIFRSSAFLSSEFETFTCSRDAGDLGPDMLHQALVLVSSRFGPKRAQSEQLLSGGPDPLL